MRFKLSIYLSLVIICFQCFGQEEFSFSIYFEDAAGNKDTIIYGFDNLASDSIDSDFGELDIVNEPWNSTLDVRIAENTRSNRWEWGATTPFFYSKKQITKKQCDRTDPGHIVEILTRNWPVTASWDSSLFHGPCLDTSAFSSCVTDYCGGSDLSMVRFNSNKAVTFTQQGPFISYPLSSVPENLDTVSFFFMAFNEIGLARNAPINDKHENLITEQIRVERNYLILNNFESGIQNIEIYDLAGMKMMFTIKDYIVDISDWKTGVYFAFYKRNDNNQMVVNKIFKQ